MEEATQTLRASSGDPTDVHRDQGDMAGDFVSWDHELLVTERPHSCPLPREGHFLRGRRPFPPNPGSPHVLDGAWEGQNTDTWPAASSPEKVQGAGPGPE